MDEDDIPFDPPIYSRFAIEIVALLCLAVASFAIGCTLVLAYRAH